MVSPDKLYVDFSTLSGRGVFAKVDINAGEIIEECHFIELEEKDWNKLDNVLKDYVFTFPVGNSNNCVVFGFGMVYNHSMANNAYWECDEVKRLYRFFAKKSIKRGEEVLINYMKWVDYQ
jgi:SET domain-containing protein